MQQTFDFARAEQLGMIERWNCPRRPGVSPAACKAVLRAIDGFGRGREAWPSESTLAQVAGVSVRTVKRSVRALVALSVLICERRGPHTLNHYRIVWSELALLCETRQQPNGRENYPAERTAPPRNRSATVSERSATVSERSATVSERSATVAPKTTEKQTGETTTTRELPVVVVSSVESAGVVRAREAVAKAFELGLDIPARLRAFDALPAAERRPGVLYNWLTHPRSFRDPAAELPAARRGPTLAQLESQYRTEQVRLVRGMRSRGASEDEISAMVDRFETHWAERLEAAKVGV